MKDLVINEKNYSIPSEWNDISIEKLQKTKYVQGSENEEIEQFIDFSVDLVSLITDISREELLDMKASDFYEVMDTLSFLKENVIPKHELELEIDGIKYKFDCDFSEMKTSQFVDIETMSSMENIVDNLHLILAVVFRPVVGKGKKAHIEEYDSKTVKARAEIFKKKMSAQTAISVNFFYQSLLQTLKADTKPSSKKQ